MNEMNELKKKRYVVPLTTEMLVELEEGVCAAAGSITENPNKADVSAAEHEVVSIDASEEGWNANEWQ